MDPKSELLVFNKKEIAVVLVLLLLVALFSFTLGLRMGRNLSGDKHAAHSDHAPMAETPHEGGDSHATPEASGTHDANPHGEAAHGEEHADEHGADKAKTEEHAESDHKEQPATTKSQKLLESAEDQADQELMAESSKEHVSPGKKVPMNLPREKRGEGASGVRYTLQVGSHRTVAEAAEQVSDLKRNGIDAFYVEAKVPGKGTWYRVGIGTYVSKEAAERAAAKQKNVKDFPSSIVQKIE